MDSVVEVLHPLLALPPHTPPMSPPGAACLFRDREAAYEAAHIRIELERHSSVMGPVEPLIAGTALNRSSGDQQHQELHGPVSLRAAFAGTDTGRRIPRQ